MLEEVNAGAGAVGAGSGGSGAGGASAGSSTAGGSSSGTSQTDVEFLSTPAATETAPKTTETAPAEKTDAAPKEINLSALEEKQPEWLSKVTDEGAKAEIAKLLAAQEKF